MTELVDGHDVVILGAGIAGSALAATLARGGLDVLLLEASQSYPDRVRGECLVPWGVKEAQDLGLLDALLSAGGQVCTRLVNYDEAWAPEDVEAGSTDLSALLPGVPGIINIAHPAHCQALLEAAVGAGAKALRGVQVDAVEAGRAPRVSYHVGDQAFEARARIIVGAEGRTSPTREALGIPLVAGRPRDLLCGMLVEDIGRWPADVCAIGTEDDLNFFVLPQSGGRARLYGIWSLDQRRRFAGAGGPDELLAAFRLKCCPKAAAVAEGHAAGPLVTFLNNESLTPAPFAEGAVLVGDAAGWVDPIIGSGLSSAYRDARLVSEALMGGDDWSTRAFARYASERSERHRRLRAVSDAWTTLYCSFDETGRARRRRYMERAPSDPTYAALGVALMCGPDSQPAEVFTPEHRARVLADA
jgi:2-polyprenyl-6-methoxyphenol hydroxylase-like FAD-dependent oxidoreductase